MSDITAESEEMQERRWFALNYRQSAGRMGSSYGLVRGPDGRFGIDCILPDHTLRRLGVVDSYEDALKIQDYCVQRDNVVKMCLIELYEHGNYEPMDKLMSDAVNFGQLPRRRVRLTLEVDVEMRGTDEEIRAYAIQHIRHGSGVRAARVSKFEGPRIEEPRP